MKSVFLATALALAASVSLAEQAVLTTVHPGAAPDVMKGLQVGAVNVTDEFCGLQAGTSPSSTSPTSRISARIRSVASSECDSTR